MSDILTQLDQVLVERKSMAADRSYVASLHQKGLNKILEKVGEEAFETVLAARDHAQSPSQQHEQALVAEVADLWFHTLVMLSHFDLNHQQVLAVLEQRFGLSGIEEKASRPQEAP